MVTATTRALVLEPLLDKRQHFYSQVLGDCIADRQARVLVVAAGERDRQVFEALGFKSVVFSNLRVEGANFAPYEFACQDAENLSYPDDAFDFAVIHEALHHCHSPHRALLELYRVARRGVLAVESRDSLLMRMLERFGLADGYEQRGLYHAGGIGGVRGGPVPNFIYRWTEREVEKAVRSYAPHLRNRFRYFYGHDAPVALLQPGAPARKALLRGAYRLYRTFVWLFPRQQNLFAFFIAKGQLPDSLQPWIELADGEPRLDMAWSRAKYGQPAGGEPTHVGFIPNERRRAHRRSSP